MVTTANRHLAPNMTSTDEYPVIRQNSPRVKPREVRDSIDKSDAIVSWRKSWVKVENCLVHTRSPTRLAAGAKRSSEAKFHPYLPNLDMVFRQHKTEE